MLDELSKPLEEKPHDLEDEVRDDDEALDVSFDNDSPLPASLKVTMKEADLKLQRLYSWLVKNGHAHEACKVKRLK